MRTCLLLIASLLFCSLLLGQPSKETDSLQTVLKNATHDSAKIMALCRLSVIERDNAKSYLYVNQALTLAQKGRWTKGEAVCYDALGNLFFRSDYAKALEYYLKSLRISEARQDRESIAIALFNIGNTYRLQENYREALPYFFKVDALYEKTNPPARINNYNLLGIVYEKLGKMDSALYYYNRGYEIAGQRNRTFTSRILRGLGNVHTLKGDTELALSFYRKSIAEAIAINDPTETCQTYIQLSKLFYKAGNQDSALFYSKQAMQIAQNRNSRQLTHWAAKQLADVYEATEPREALRYYKLSAAMKDSIFGAESQAKVQNLTFSELERQREAAETKRKQEEDRKHNLQYAAIAFGVITLLIGFLVLSHSVIANQKLIRFLGVISLLIVFEFLNLLLHPWLGAVTHHSPVLMLLAMVCVAALLVPLHHRLEHWITHKMVEKNNRIRLAAAKRTIQQLEDGTETVHPITSAQEKH